MLYLKYNKIKGDKMKDTKIIMNGKEYLVNKESTLLEVFEFLEEKPKSLPILAKVDNEYKELTESITPNTNIEFLTLEQRPANKVYLNSLILMLAYSYKKLMGSKIKVNHSLDRGLYIETENKITEEDLEKLKDYMKKVVEEDLPIEKITVERVNVMDYFHKNEDFEKEANIKYNTNTYMTLYKLGEHYDYFYSLMVPSTKYLSEFDLTYLNEYGFVLRYKTIYDKENIKEYEHRNNIYELFKDSRSWAKSIGLEYVNDLNETVMNSKIGEIILMDEAKKTAEITNIAKEITENEKIKIILIAGPSSSGKTTTCKKIALALKSYGKNPVMLSMDDYFKNRTETPLKEDGTKDYENITAIDLDLFNETIFSLLEGKEVIAPRYNFLTGEKEFVSKIHLEEGEIILIEGIHALNPKILENIESDKKCKIYLSALTQLNVDKHNRISTTDNRLLRRIVRDNRTRGYKVENTLKNWANVREGEEKYIFPYQDTATYTLNTALIYELGVLKVYVEPLLYSVSIDSPYYEDAKRLINFLRIILPVSSELVPKDSILREFIGGSIFE